MQQTINTCINDTKKKMVFNTYLKYQGQNMSTFFLYSNLKKKEKISKDIFYAHTSILEKENMLFLVKKYAQISLKKIYFIDFNMPKAIKTIINLKTSLENAILLELIKNGEDIEEIYYTNELNFYIPKKKQAFVLMIFKELEDIKLQIEHLHTAIYRYQKELNEVYLIIIDEQIPKYTQKINNINYELLTFWEFATR